MPIYEFRNEEGVIEEHLFSMHDAPSIGSTIVVDDRLLTRIPSRSFHASVSHDRHFVAYSQPTCNPDGSVPDGVVPAPNYDMNPSSPTYLHARFSGKRDVEKYVSSCDGQVKYGDK